MKEPHEPCTCDQWNQWLEKASKYRDVKSDANVIASQIWISNNTKDCPGCKAHIQKNEGCNHMTCKTCRHEFCWICMGPWREHGEKSGGYFSCNKFKGAGPSKARDSNRQLKEKALELEQFLHYFERYVIY